MVPLLTPCLSRGATHEGGHIIPASTRVLVNAWAICRDLTSWEAPAEFKPERFLGSGVDVKGHDFELLPSGSGRWMCPDLLLRLRMVQVILVNVLHRFAWRHPDEVASEELSMEKFGLTMPRMVPLEAVAEPLLRDHLYSGP
ncbi:hypothetical protein PR202_gb12355 [Eleusine coracana subsp. coracana]|uniref:Uncharacterized protein n=1 Tax=Eleusine coracana subsp. coracana TaxID=191504 RepID=A0AAV5EQ02_ELECO|nr:hypothetical protein PR202_gb12355 [Eleusine coracana subsp. coracana]